jgi:protein-disulfide isomerase
MQDTNLTPAPEPKENQEMEEELQGNEEGNQSILRPSVLLWSVFVAAAFVLGLVAGYFIWERPLQAKVSAAEQQVAALQKTSTAGEAVAAAEATADPAGAVPEQVKRYDVSVDDDPALGKADAPITIVEFSDYQCPFCQKWHDEVFTKLEEKYGDKIRLVYRDFPLYGLHAEAESAAEAANCAGAQDRYWDFHNLLFTGGKQLGADAYTAYAKALKLDTAKFQKCMDDDTYLAEVKADYDFASQLGVRSTPTFFINGLAVVGAQPFEVFQQVIDLELAGKIPK